jgi:hypothetical protein
MDGTPRSDIAHRRTGRGGKIYLGDFVPNAQPPNTSTTECVPSQNPPQPAAIGMGLHIGNDVSPDAAEDTGEDAPHRPNVHVTDVPRDDSVAPERWNA